MIGLWFGLSQSWKNSWLSPYVLWGLLDFLIQLLLLYFFLGEKWAG